jgi:rhodanese-related sulfurtransferase
MKIESFFLSIFLISATIDIMGEASIRYITCQEVAENMSYLSAKNENRWYLINVLPRYICSECSITDSINIPVHILDKKLNNKQKWPRSRKIILYCAGGNSPLSRYAYEIVKKLGFDDIQILNGGIAAWKQNGYPVTGKCLSSYLDHSL